jgi:hypothetical protein
LEHTCDLQRATFAGCLEVHQPQESRLRRALAFLSIDDKAGEGVGAVPNSHTEPIPGHCRNRLSTGRAGGPAEGKIGFISTTKSATMEVVAS